MSLAVDLIAVADLDDEHDECLVAYRRDDSIVAFANTIQVIFAGHLLHTVRSWIVPQRFDAFDDPLLSRFSERLELSFGRRGEEDRVSHGRGLEAKILQDHIQGFGALLLGLC